MLILVHGICWHACVCTCILKVNVYVSTICCGHVLVARLLCLLMYCMIARKCSYVTCMMHSINNKSAQARRQTRATPYYVELYIINDNAQVGILSCHFMHSHNALWSKDTISISPNSPVCIQHKKTNYLGCTVWLLRYMDLCGRHLLIHFLLQYVHYGSVTATVNRAFAIINAANMVH